MPLLDKENYTSNTRAWENKGKIRSNLLGEVGKVFYSPLLFKVSLEK